MEYHKESLGEFEICDMRREDLGNVKSKCKLE